MKELIINHFLNYEFIYIFLLCSIAFLLISSFIKQKFIKKTLILLFSINFILFLFELILSFFMPLATTNYNKNYINNCDINSILKQRQVKLLLPNEEIYEVWNDNTYSNKFNDFMLIFDQIYLCYNNSFRITKCDNFSTETYVFLGCSFVFGLGLDNNETLPYYFSKKFDFNKNIINCSVSGKSTNTALNILNNSIFKNLLSKEAKIKNCFYMLLPYHIDRNFLYEHFSYCMDGYLYKNNKWYIPTRIGKIKYIFARSYIFRKVFVPIIDEKFKQYYEDYMIQSLEEMNKVVKEKYKSKLTIIVWNIGLYNKGFIERLKLTNLDLIFLPDKFNLEEEGYRIEYDGHPTAKANEELAQILYNHINGLE